MPELQYNPEINAIPHLPLECVARVIELVDNHQDMFSLLTVSKDVFLIAARRLYRNPIKTVTKTTHLDENIRKLVILLLSLSPAGGENLDFIRRSNGLPPSGTPLNLQPMLDYLSLVKVVHWPGKFFDGDRLPVVLEYPNKWDIYMHLNWAFVGHRLDEVEELEIEVDDQERYLSNVAKMTRLRKIWIHIGENCNYQDMYNFAEVMIKAIQLHHGPHQLTECHMIPNPLLRGPRANTSSYIFEDIDVSGALRVLSLLPPPRRFLKLPTPDGSAVSLDQPFDPCAADIEKLDIGTPSFMMKTMIKAYPGHSVSQILQRFRGMTSLCIHPEVAIGNDENLLTWAACEAEHYHSQPGGRQLIPLVPLEELEVEYEHKSVFTRPRARTTTPKWKILQDGLVGFSSTLRLLEIHYPQSVDVMADHLFTIPRPLHKLKSLILHGLTIDRSAWVQAPNIEELQINFGFPILRAITAAPNESQDESNTGATQLSSISNDTIAATVTIKQQLQRQLPEFWFHCPKLTKLTLQNRAISLLDPNCLHLSPNLQELELFIQSVIARECITSDGVDSCEAREVLRVLHPTRWTWDWSFPVLRSLILEFSLHEIGFSLAILRSCPTLELILLHHFDDGHRFPLRVKGILDGSFDKNNGMLPFTHTSLLSIEFRGFWDIEIDELACLLQVLPRLMVIEFGFVHFDEGFGDRELIEITRTHPTLERVITAMERTTEPLSALGLSDVNAQQQEKMEINITATDGENDNKLPKKRTITYGFKFDRFALRLL